MDTDIHAMGFTLTPALRDAVESRAQALRLRLPGRLGALSVRLFDVNGTRGGPDKGCLVHARLARRGTSVVATEVDEDLYRAIERAFDKLQRGARAAIERGRAGRRSALAGAAVRHEPASSGVPLMMEPAPGVAVVAVPP
ncbi:MAG: HPF/RaiA family ribosome-associated protein [Steroidobacteraceae bacterium]|nr:HPF/RaiA family ribosome-associated protein [Steroidobacteraceae bacterium]